jgi:hypothetical protein
MPTTETKDTKSRRKKLVFDDDSEKAPRQGKSSAASTAAPVSPQKRKRGLDAFTSPVAKKKKVAAVTPEEKERKALSRYVPEYIHKAVGYQREGKATLVENTITAFKLIVENYTIPEDFEQSRSFGPLGGTSFEERVIRAYTLGKLKPKDEKGIAICTQCCVLGHKRVECPTLI